MKIFLMLLFIFASGNLYGQITSEVVVNKNSFESGEKIILTATFYNGSDTIHTFRGSSSYMIRLKFSGVNLFGDGVTTDDARDTLFVGDKRELTWELDTSSLFLPITTGEQTIVLDYLGLIDSVSFNAEQYLGGSLDIYFESSIDTSVIRNMADSLDAEVLETRNGFSKWAFSGIQIDSLADELIKDSRVEYIEIPSREFVHPTSVIATGIENKGAQNYEFRLHQNYPNPFNPTTTFSFGLSQSGNVRLSIFNMIGQEVAVLQNNPLTAGKHSINFGGSNLASGTYFYTLKTANQVLTKKFTLIK